MPDRTSGYLPEKPAGFFYVSDKMVIESMYFDWMCVVYRDASAAVDNDATHIHNRRNRTVYRNDLKSFAIAELISG